MTNPVLEAKITDIHSWWEVPCIAHFCSLFRASFNLIDFDIEDLEEALLTDDATDSGSTLIQELIVRLLRGYYGNNSISTFNYQMFLRRLFRQKCREFQCYNPFDSDMDFQFLPMRTKVEILHMLCDFRLDADDVLDILKDLDSDSLRVHPLGYDANKSAYWYFYGTRLYREDYPKKTKVEESSKKKRKGKKNRNKEESDEEVELGSGIWQVVCFTESDWERLALNTEDATDKNEQTLHQIIEEDFLPEIPKLFQEKERLQRKRFLELHPRKSSRLENLKRRKEEEIHDHDECKRAFACDATESDDSQYNAEQAKNARYERWKNRNIQKEVFYDSDNLNSDSESWQESLQYFNQKSSYIVGRGRQTNNSLSSATEEILIESTERSRSPEWFDPKLEDLQIGMYKVLNKLKEHEDSWPFLQPVNEDDAPNYYQVVKSPMSLQKMEDKLDSGRYKSLSEFKHDFHLILANCKQYNGSQNEYTLMGENLEKVFNISVHRYIILSNSSEGEEGAEVNDFHELSGSLKKKKRRKLKRISSKSTVEADKENERKISSDLVVSTEVASHAVEVSLNIDSRILEHKPVKRGKGRPPKNASTFDAFDIVAEQTLRDINKLLDDTPKYSDFCSASNSPSLLSSPKVIETSLEEFPSTTIAEPSPPTISAPKITSAAINVNPVRPYKHKDPNKKRSAKENHHKHLQIIKQSRRDPQRTIDRLQPGKSKGNLISTICKTQSSSRTTLTEEFSVSAKIKENTVAKITPALVENTQHRLKPMLSLGSVLSHDVINLDAKSKKYTFSDNDSAPSDEEYSFSDNDEISSAINVENNEMQAENLALDKPCSESLYSSSSDERKNEDRPLTDVPLKSENSNEATKSSSTSMEKSDKPTPNLSAWFKAFGAPKAQSVNKRKNDGNIAGIYNEQPATPSPTSDSKDDFLSSRTSSLTKSSTNALSVDDDRYDLNELPPPTPGRFFTYDEDSHSRPIPSLPSPDMKPLKRQRKLSTGSSVSERSSFSQDQNDPSNSPHPSLDESMYQSPQPYHQSPNHSISGALKVGFYQDTFPRGSSDKSNSCSPREPVNSCSPQHVMFSPHDTVTSPHGRRDAVISSPHGSDVISSPRDQGYGLQIASPRNAITSPRYASGSPRESFAESSPIVTQAICTKSPPVYSSSPVADQEALLSPRIPSHDEIYQPETSLRTCAIASTTRAPEEKLPFSIYPVKKRISAELEHTSKVLDDSLAPGNVVEKQVYENYPPSLTQPILPPIPFSSAESGSKVSSSSMPISLAHHPPHSHHPHFMNSYSENLLLSANPYFCKDMFVPSQGVAAPQSANISQSAPHISPLFAQQADPSTGIYSATSERNQSHYSSSRQTASIMGVRSYDRNGSGSVGTPLDFTTVSTSSSASTSPLALTSKTASDAYNAQFHHSRFHSASHSESNVLNFSSKNLAPSSSAYVDQRVINETTNRPAQSPLTHYHQPPPIPASPNPNNANGGIDSSGAMHLNAENIYRTGGSMLEDKLGCTTTVGNYRSGVSYHNVPNTEYFNDSKMSASYRNSEFRYSNYPLTNGEKQYYPVTQPKNGVVDSNNAAEVANFNNHRLAHNCATASSSSNTRYDVSSYHNHRGGGLLPPSTASPALDQPSSVLNTTSVSTIPLKSARKSKKKKATTSVLAPNSIESVEQSSIATASMYSHFLGANQAPSSVAAAAAAAAAASQDFQHNGLLSGGAFNFGTSPTVVQKEYHQYFDNLRSQRYFGAGNANASEVPNNSVLPEKTTTPPVINHPPSSSATSSSFQFLTQRSSPSFSLAAQAFINASATAPPCGPPPPSIYSSPYLQRTPDELLRPMILPQGLMSAHTGAYPPPPHPPPHGYINMHDPISRSPWL